MTGRKTRRGDGETVVLVWNPSVGAPDALPLLSANMCRRGDGEVCRQMVRYQATAYERALAVAAK